MELTVSIPEGVKAAKEGHTLAVSGKNGSTKKAFSHPRVKLDIADATIKISTDSEIKKDRAVAGTWAAHIKNMIYGADTGFEYKLKVVFTHFPMIIKANPGEVTVSNFMGEKGSRHAPIIGDSKVKVEKEQITVTGADKEDVAQTAANIEQACKKRRKDLRVFQDGTYIVKKG